MSGHGPWDLYEEHFVTQEGDGNCCFTTIAVIAYDVSRTGRQRKRWSVKRPGDTGELFDNFYQIFLGGCCGDSDSYRYYHSATGKLSYESVQPLLRARVTYQDLVRYVAVLNDRSWGQNLKEGTSSMSYGSDAGPLQRLLLRYPNHMLLGAKLRGQDDKTAAEIDLDGYRKPESRALLSGFSIELEFREFDGKDTDVAVFLPVEGDVVRVDLAKLPQGLTVEPLSVAQTGSAKTKSRQVTNVAP